MMTKHISLDAEACKIMKNNISLEAEVAKIEEETERQRVAKERDIFFDDLVKESKERFDAILDEPNMFKQKYTGEQY
eukprot:15145377-Heterocapsa_arctica.AAC.1